MRAIWTIFLTALLCASAFAGVIDVTSPARGTANAPTLVGSTTSVSISLREMGRSEARISVRIVRQSDGVVILNNNDAVRVKPDTTNDNGSGTYTLTFQEGVAEVVYRVEVRATPIQAGATTYNTDQNLFVKPDVTRPKILEFNPLSNAAVRGITTIRVRIQETNLKDWRIQINNQDIPNNSGTTVSAGGEFTVVWDPTGIRFDSTQTINIRVRDDADNETTQNVNVQLDRVAPVITFQSPQNNARFGAGTTINVVIDIRDLSATSVPPTGVDVVVRDANGRFITRVARISQTGLDGTTARWTGRIRWRTGLPTTMVISATAVDRAGNRTPTPQTVRISITP